MRLGLFLATCAGLLLTTSLVVPVPYGPQPIPGGDRALIDPLPRCLRLEYEPTLSERMPAQIRLRADAGMAPDFFAADGGPERLRLYNHASWRPAGADSLDIGWHHSPIIRLPIRGDSLVGRVAWAGAAPLWALAGRRDYRVVAFPMPCSEFSVPAS